MDMTERDCAEMLLTQTDYKMLTPDEKLEYTVFEYFSHDEDFRELADRKVAEFRKEHNYSDVCINEIPVDDVLRIYDDDMISFAYVARLLANIYNRNIRLSKLIVLDAPDIIIKNEVRLIRELLDELLTGDTINSDESLYKHGYTIVNNALYAK